MANGDIIRIKCPNLVCTRVLGVPIGARGKMIRCKVCGTKIRVPAAKIVPEVVVLENIKAR